MIRNLEDHARHEDALSYERYSLPDEDHSELQATVYPGFICLTVIDYETGELQLHVDYIPH